MKPIKLSTVPQRLMSFTAALPLLMWGMSSTNTLASTTEYPDAVYSNPDEVPMRPASEATYAIVVNSVADGEITPDGSLTLREAIALTNNEISFAELSDLEKQQIQPQADYSSITFDLVGTQTIYLQNELPPLRQTGLVLDGSLNGDAKVVLTPDLAVIASANELDDDALDDENILNNFDGDSIDRYMPEGEKLKYGLPIGFSVIADDITIKDFQFYGFHSSAYKAYPFVGAVVISTGQVLYDLWRLPDIVQVEAPQNVRIENNIFGMTPEQLLETQPTLSFGLVLYDAIAATVTNNEFLNLNGSGILTGKVAKSVVIADNLFLANGGNGLRDAVRLEGDIAGTSLVNNRFCGNSGAGIFLFKPEGAIAVKNNLFDGNGSRNEREFVLTHPDDGIAAIYLMGSEHEVTGNTIMNQGGSGVVVAAYPRSQGNLITDNIFANLQGLSIDLATRRTIDIHTYQDGDGANPWRDSKNRRIDTGNGAVNAPHFANPEFFPFGQEVVISGIADPKVTIDFYRVLEPTSEFGPLNEFLTQTTTDEEGHFSLALTEWELGDRLSAIATDPTYGTSEPAENIVIRSFEDTSRDFPKATSPVTTAKKVCHEFAILDTEPE